MNKIIITWLLLFLFFMMGCKSSSDIDGSGPSGQTTLKIAEFTANAQFMGDDAQQLVGQSKNSILLALADSSSQNTPSVAKYKYSVRALLETTTTGNGAEMLDVVLTYYKNGTPFGVSNMGKEAFMEPFLEANKSAYTYSLVLYHQEVFTSVKIKVGYKTNGMMTSVESTANFPDPSTKPFISRFNAGKSTLAIGEQTTLGWKVINAKDISINRNGKLEFSNLAAEDLLVIDPTKSGQEFNTYRLIAKNGANEVYTEIQIRVTYPDVEYRVYGVGEAENITLSGAGGSTVQYSNVKLPFSYKISSAKSGDFLYVSAQNGKNSGCITVDIYTNSHLYKYATSCGQYVIASASGTY